MPAIVLPPQLARPGYRFIKLGSRGEALKIPIEPGWNIFDLGELKAHLEEMAAQWDADEAAGKHAKLRSKGKFVKPRPEFRGRLNNYSFDDPEFIDWLAKGNNYGVTGAGGLIKFESDNVARWLELGALFLMPKGFAVKSSSTNRRHFYFEFDGEIADIPIKDPETGEDIGHLRGTGTADKHGGQVVGPGSLHPKDVRYTVVQDLPIPKIDRETIGKILAVLQPAPEGSASTTTGDWRAEIERDAAAGRKDDPLNSLRVVDIMPPAGETSQSGDELRGDHPIHGSKNGGNYVINLAKNVWHCKRCEAGGGPAAAIAVKEGLIPCSGAVPGAIRGDLFKAVLKIAHEKYGLPYDESISEEPKGPTVLTAFQKLIENEDKITGSCLWDWRMEKQRIQVAIKSGYLSRKGEEKAHKFLKKFNKILEGVGIDYDDLYPINRSHNDKEQFSPEIREKALAILKTGDPVQYIADNCGKTVLGAEKAFKKLTCGISVQNINQSYGFHPKLNGDSSGGKTYTVYTFAHHMPKEAVIKGSMSAKAGFYHNDGGRVFRILDDYQAGNEDLDTVIKQTSSEFHAKYTHRTVTNHEGKTLTIDSEQTWAITSVDASQEIQVLNRQMPINIDDSLGLTKRVNEMTVQRYANGERQYPVTEDVLISRCIFQILRDEGYIDVKIPFGDRIRWLDTTNRRNPSLFLDLVVAFTGMFRYQRARDSEGYYLATEDDFQAAKALFTDNDGQELVKRLTKKEREALEFLASRPEGIVQDDLAERLKVSRQRAGHILFGQPKGCGGLMGKVPIKESAISNTITIGQDERRTIHRTVYSLKDYDGFTGFDAIVRLEPQPEEPCNGATDGATDGATKDTASSGNDEMNEIEKKREREERERVASSPPESQGFHENEDCRCKRCTKADDSDGHRCNKGSPPLQTVAPTPVGSPTTAPAGKGDASEFTTEEAALLSRICGRMRQQSPDKPLDPFILSVGMRANDHDIGIDRCKAWIASEAGA